jgi:hypothetical protein
VQLPRWCADREHATPGGQCARSTFSALVARVSHAVLPTPSYTVLHRLTRTNTYQHVPSRTITYHHVSPGSNLFPALDIATTTRASC